MDVLKPVRAFDGYQQRRRWLALPVAVLKKFSDDQAGSLAALIAYYGFFSLFPLLLVFVTVLGFVLNGDPGLRDSIKTSVLGHFPVIGKDLQVGSLHGHTVSLVIGLAGALWAGLAITRATQNAFDHIWAVPFKDRAGYVQTRLRGLATLVILGVLNIAASLASGLVSGGLGGAPLLIAGIAVSLLLNLALFMAAFRLLSTPEAPTRALVPGAILASVLWELLQLLGGYYIGHVLKKASGTSGVFGLVIALLSWLYLGAQAMLYAAELNVVLARRLWPRSLLSTSLPGDEQTLEALAKVEERTDEEHIDVRFDN
jgi:inner membrane protein YhjD